MHTIDINEFRKQFESLCIYEIEGSIKSIQVIEYAPEIFRQMRKQSKFYQFSYIYIYIYYNENYIGK